MRSSLSQSTFVSSSLRQRRIDPPSFEVIALIEGGEEREDDLSIEGEREDDLSIEGGEEREDVLSIEEGHRPSDPFSMGVKARPPSMSDIIALVGHLLDVIHARYPLDAVITLYHSTAQKDILTVLVPTLKRLRNRVEKGDPTYFASDVFLTGVMKAVEGRVQTLIDGGKLNPNVGDQVSDHVSPILKAIQSIARVYDPSRGEIMYETLLRDMLTIINHV